MSDRPPNPTITVANVDAEISDTAIASLAALLLAAVAENGITSSKEEG